MCNDVIVKSGVTLSRIISKRNTSERQKVRMKEKNLHVNISDDYDDIVLMVAMAGEHVESKIGFLNIGCSNHMTDQREWLIEFDELKMSNIILVDNSSLQAKGTCNIVIQGSNKEKTMIKDILYIPGMKCNLLSVRQLVKKGFSVLMKNGAL